MRLPRRSLDDLVGPSEDRWRHGEAERLGGVEVDDQLERRGLLDRKIGRLGALEDPVDEIRGAAIEINLIRIVGQQTSGLGTRSPRAGQGCPRKFSCTKTCVRLARYDFQSS